MPILVPLSVPLRGLFLRQITRYNPQLASRLHDAPGSKSYTVSALLSEYGRPLPFSSWLQAGQQVWARFTSLEEELSELLLKKILPGLPGQLTLYKMNFSLEGWTLNPFQHPLAGQTDFMSLKEEKWDFPSSRWARLDFLSPTVFRTNGNDISLPLPGFVFRSWWEKWNAFSPVAQQIDTSWPDFAEKCILVSSLQGLNTQQWEFANGARGAATGFLGGVEFMLLPQKKMPGFCRAGSAGSEKIFQNLAVLLFTAVPAIIQRWAWARHVCQENSRQKGDF